MASDVIGKGGDAISREQAIAAVLELNATADYSRAIAALRSLPSIAPDPIEGEVDYEAGARRAIKEFVADDVDDYFNCCGDKARAEAISSARAIVDAAIAPDAIEAEYREAAVALAEAWVALGLCGHVGTCDEDKAHDDADERFHAAKSARDAR